MADNGGASVVPVHTILEVYKVADMSLVRVLPSAEDEVNAAAFHPHEVRMHISCKCFGKTCRLCVGCFQQTRRSPWQPNMHLRWVKAVACLQALLPAQGLNLLPCVKLTHDGCEHLARCALGQAGIVLGLPGLKGRKSNAAGFATLASETKVCRSALALIFPCTAPHLLPLQRHRSPSQN